MKNVVLTVLAILGLSVSLLACKEKVSDGASISKVVPMSAGEWSKMNNETIYARNFERKIKLPREVYNQVVTIYDLPMTDDRRVGHIETKNEYIEIFKTVMPTNHVVIQIRVDREKYWILSRQTFRLSGSLDKINPEESENSYRIFRIALQNEIDSTRYQLQNKIH